MPPHAAINETVNWVKRRVRARAGGLVNAVLRRIAELAPSDVEARASWSDADDELLLADGRARALSQPVLPESPSDRISITASIPMPVFTRWADDLGWKVAKGLALNAMTTPPLIVNAASAGALPVELAEHARAHTEAGFWVYDGPRDTLAATLNARRDVWVQDPGSARSVGVARGLEPELVVDLCAGRGTKTRQLRSMFPSARLIATDADRARLDDLRAVFAGDDAVNVVELDAIEGAVGDGADLVLLDVPCSNSGVLARRAEARYRLGKAQTKRLVKIQDGLLERGSALCAPAGHVVYATCSIDEAENDARVEAAERLGLREIGRKQTMPEGAPGDPAVSHFDGGFAALLAR